MTTRLSWPLLTLLALLAGPASAMAAPPTSLVLLRTRTPEELQEFVLRAEAAGAHVSVAIAPDAALVHGDASALADPALARFVASVHRERLATAEAAGLAPRHAFIARSWNEAVSMGELAPAPLRGAGGASMPDAGRRPVEISPLATARAVTTSSRMPLGAQFLDTSEFLMGWVAVGVWLLEAAGSTYDWSEFEEQQTIGGVLASLDNWVRKAGPFAGLTFFVETNLDVPVSGVPIENGMNADATWMNEVLTARGWPGADAFERCFAYNNHLRDTYNTNWCCSIVIADSDPSVNQGLFAGGGYAWAYFGGPWIYMSRYSTWAYNWPSYWGVVPMHELGHIFMATDEYDGIIMNGGYMNSPDSPSSVACLMNQNDSTTVCVPTRRQLGIGDDNANGVFDPVDIQPTITVTPAPDPTTGPTITVTGTAAVRTRPNLNPLSNYSPPHDMTISTISRVEGKVGVDLYSDGAAVDGAFDEYTEDWSWTSGPLADGTYVLFFRARSTAGNASSVGRDTVTVTNGGVSVSGPSAALQLGPPHPNPARDAARFELRLPRTAAVRLGVVDAAGRHVRVLLAGEPVEAGARMIEWDGRTDAGARARDGVYWIVGEAAGQRVSRRLVWME